jgi:hypothetical protein
MPSFIKTKAQEKLWKEAKKIVEKEYNLKEDDKNPENVSKFFALVTGVYKKMNHGSIPENGVMIDKNSSNRNSTIDSLKILKEAFGQKAVIPSDDFTKKINRFAEMLSQQTLERMKKQGYTNILATSGKVSIGSGSKYYKVDMDRSGKYMVDIESGTIYGIKAYGVPNKIRNYGTLDTIDDWFWGDYHAIKSNTYKNSQME